MPRPFAFMDPEKVKEKTLPKETLLTEQRKFKNAPVEPSEPEVLAGIRVSYLYEGRLKEAVEAYKYEGMREYAFPFASWMVTEGHSKVEEWEIDVVSAVPLSKKRLKARGYNQAELLAKRIAAELHKPYLELVQRSKETRALKTLGKQSRIEELKGAFKAADLERFRGFGLRVLLVDDILTTGTTARSVAKAILDALPDAKVFVWAFCQDLPGGAEVE